MATLEFTLDDDNFDDAFFQEVDKLEILATSSRNPNNNQIVASITSSSSFYSVPQQLPQPTVVDTITTHSPPRELSQRNPSTVTRSVCSPFSGEQQEIERLKLELSVASKELLDLKQECSELKKQRDKEQELKSVHANKKPRTCNSKDHSRNGLSPTCENVDAVTDRSAPQIGKVKKSTGIQTDVDDESLNASTSGSIFTYRDASELLSIWCPSRVHRSRRSFVSKLIEACASDFCALFGCLGLNMSSNMLNECLSRMPTMGDSPGLHSAEVPKEPDLYSMLMKLTDDRIPVSAFLDAVLDLCSLENVLVVHRSLRILYIALEQVISIERTRSLRDNVKVERCYSGSDAVCFHDPEFEKSVDWLHLYTSVCQITIKLTEEQGRAEAVTILNIILRTFPCSDREKFGGSIVFEAVALLLKKEAGLFCRKEAVHLLYLLLNCPSILASFCSSWKGAESHTRSSKDVKKSLACQEYHVLEQLAKCVICTEYDAKELDLCRNAIVVLAFLASSGNEGLEIFLFHKLSKGANFLGLVLQVLVSEIDTEALDSCTVSEFSKERTLLMREILLLLNRLTSHPVCSATVLQVLTSCRDMVSLAINIATRLSKKSKRLLKSDSITRQMREYEVVDLACCLKKRLFTFLRDTISS